MGQFPRAIDASERSEDIANFAQSALEAAANAIIVTDTEGRILWVNPAFTELTGYKATEAIGQSPKILRSGKHPREFYTDLWSTVNSGEVWRGDMVNRRSSGELYYEEMTITPVLDSHGRPYRFIAVKQDVTKRKKAELDLLRTQEELTRTLRALKIKEQRSRLIVESAADAFLAVDCSGQIIEWNSRAETMFGWQRLEAIGLNVREVLTGNAVQMFLELPTMREQRVVETTGVTKEGREFPLEVSASYIQCGKDSCWNLFCRDSSKRREREAQRVHAQKLEALGSLAAGIAHEINTPIQFVGDNTRYLKEAFEELRPLLQYLETLVSSLEQGAVDPSLVARARAAISDVDLEFLLEESGAAATESLLGLEQVASIVRGIGRFSHTSQHEKTLVDLRECIQSTLTVCRNQWSPVAEVKTLFDPRIPPLRCYPSELNQVLLNIISNAAQAIANTVDGSPRALGEITIRTRKTGDSAEIRISDTGPGISPKIQDRIFDPFFTTKAVGRGTGQGLAISRAIVVERHQGTLTVESREGQGSTFVLVLPFNPQKSEGFSRGQP